MLSSLKCQPEARLQPTVLIRAFASNLGFQLRVDPDAGSSRLRGPPGVRPAYRPVSKYTTARLLWASPIFGSAAMAAR